MQKCYLPITLSLGTSLLHSLGTDNPTYSHPLQLALASLLPSHSPTSTIATDMSLLACHAAVQTLHLLLTPPSSLLPVPDLINPILSLLAVPNIAIHAEAADLIDILVRNDSLREEVIRELVEMTEEPRGGQAMKQHHHVYINNVSLVRNGNISMTTSVSTYPGYSMRGDQDVSTRFSTLSHVFSSNPAQSLSNVNSTNNGFSFSGIQNHNSSPRSDTSSPRNNSNPTETNDNTSNPTSASPEKEHGTINTNDNNNEAGNTNNVVLARLSTTKQRSSSDLLAQIHHNYSVRLINSHHKSTSDLLSDTNANRITAPQRNSSSDLLSYDQHTISYTRLASGRRASASELISSPSLTTGLLNTDLFSSKHSLGGSRQTVLLPPLEIAPDIPFPPLPSSPSSGGSSGSPRQPVSPLATSRKRGSLTIPSPSSPSPSSPTTPTSPNSTFSFTTPTSSLIHGSPVVTTTTHEACAMVMHRLTSEWGTLLIQHNAIPAIVCAIVNTYLNFCYYYLYKYIY